MGPPRAIGNATSRKRELQAFPVFLQRVGNIVEHIAEVITDEPEGGDKDHCDQRRDQAVFDGGRAGFATDELEQLRHVYSPLVVVGREALSVPLTLPTTRYSSFDRNRGENSSHSYGKSYQEPRLLGNTGNVSYYVQLTILGSLFHQYYTDSAVPPSAERTREGYIGRNSVVGLSPALVAGLLPIRIQDKP